MPKRLRYGMLLIAMLLIAACANPTAQTPTNPSTAINQTAPTATSAPATALPATAVPTVEPSLPVPAWTNNAVCYEIFVRSFYDSNGDGIGDLNGLIEKLDYVNDGDPNSTRDLGANCIWLMPISAAASYHGYDVVDYYQIEPDYGSNDDFKRLVAESQKRGIKIVIDLVLNHTSREHPWFQDALNNPNSPYRDWYIWSESKPAYRSPFGGEAWHQSPVRNEFYYGVFWEGMPDLNYRNPAVTAEALKISAFWLNDMGVDGFRLDAIKHMIEKGAAQEDTPETHAWLREYHRGLKAIKPDVFTIGEIFGGNPFTLKNYYPNQADLFFEFDVAKQLVGAANVGTASLFMRALQEAYTKLPEQRWSPFLTNHDQNRAMSTWGSDVNKAKVAATALLTLPGLPFVYYGEEIGMVGVKPDEQIRTPLQWDDSQPGGGFSTGTPWIALQPNATTVHIAAQDTAPDSLLNHYRQLIHLHQREMALAQGGFAPITSSNSSVAAYLRHTDESFMLILINFDKQASGAVQLSAETSPLANGNYQAQAIFGPELSLTIATAADGAWTTPITVPDLPAHTGVILRVTK
jgi:glycosidase